MQGGGAGGIAIMYLSSSNNYNSHSISDVTLSSCSGGSYNQQGVGAGAVAIGYNDNVNTYNSQTFSNLSVTHCRGGDWFQGAGALAVVLQWALA